MNALDRLRRLAGWYFYFQAALVTAWWALLWLEPWTRTFFVPADYDERVLTAFALPDLAVLVLGSRSPRRR